MQMMQQVLRGASCNTYELHCDVQHVTRKTGSRTTSHVSHVRSNFITIRGIEFYVKKNNFSFNTKLTKLLRSYLKLNFTFSQGKNMVGNVRYEGS